MFVSFQREGEIGELITSLQNVTNTIDEKIASGLLGLEQDASDAEDDSDDEEGASDMDVDDDDDDDDEDNSEDDDDEDSTDEENEEGESDDEDDDEDVDRGSSRKRKRVCTTNLSRIRNFDLSLEILIPLLSFSAGNLCEVAVSLVCQVLHCLALRFQII